MDFSFTREDELFRQEVREWLQANVPDVRVGLTMSREDELAWQQKLASKGWLAAAWPREYGGPGWTATQRYIWDEECARADAPYVSVFGLTMCGPVLMKFGTEAQKAEHLPPIANGTRLWCQGYSEPGAGSDLASLRTRAERDGDHYVVNGQKIWNTAAHIADWVFCLVRTQSGERKQEGISFLLIDMTTPGIEVRPIRSIDGEHHLNEIFFENVRVPAENLVGEEGRGWTIAKYLLGHERTSIAGVPIHKARLTKMRQLVAADPALAQDPRVAEELAAFSVDLMALEFTNLRALERAQKGVPPGPESSGLKIKGTELQQAMEEYLVEMGAWASLPWQSLHNEGDEFARAVPFYNIGRASTIYGGSNEIQRNVLAKFALGLGG